MISGSLGITEPWYIKECKVDSKTQTMHIYVSVREETKFACPKCGGDTKRYGYEKKRKLLIDKQMKKSDLRKNQESALLHSPSSPKTRM